MGSLEEQVYSFRISLSDFDFNCKEIISLNLRGSIVCGRGKFVKILPGLAPKIAHLKYEDVPVVEALKKDQKYMTLIRF